MIDVCFIEWICIDEINNEAPVTYNKNNLILQNEQPKDMHIESSVSSMIYSTVVLVLI